VLIGVGPDADWRAKLFYQVMEGEILDAYLQLSVQKPTSRRTFLQAARNLRVKLVRMCCCGGREWAANKAALSSASPTRKNAPVGSNGTVMEVTKWLKPLVSVSGVGDCASVQAATQVITEQASKYFQQEPS
jgi:hypothetical protein